MADQQVVPDYLADGRTTLQVTPPFKVVQEVAKEAGEPLWLRAVEQAVAFTKAVIWPLLAILLLIIYHRPLAKVADQLPDVVAQAQKISVGGLSMEIQVQAKRTGGAGLAEALNQLDPGDIEELIHTGRGPWGLVGSGMNSTEWFMPSELELQKLRRLEASGLLEAFIDRSVPSNGTKENITLDAFFARLHASGAKPLDLDAHESRRLEVPNPQSPELQRLRSMQYRLTKPGKDAFESILNAITAQLSQGKKQPLAKEEANSR